MQEILKCHIFSIALIAVNSGKGWYSQLFCSGPRTGARGENVSPPTTGFKNDQQRSGVSVGRKHFVFICFSERGGFRYLKARLQKNRANGRRSDNVGPISSHICRRIDPTLKLCNYKATTQIIHVFRTKAQIDTPFFKEILKICKCIL